MDSTLPDPPAAIALPSPAPGIGVSRLRWFATQLRSQWRADEEIDGKATAARFRARQLQAVYKLTPLVALGAVAAAGAIWFAFRERIAGFWLDVWLAAALLIACYGMLQWRVWRVASGRRTASTADLHRLTAFGVVHGTLWALVPITLFEHADLPQQFLIGCIFTGLISGGGLFFSMVAPSGLTYIGILTAGAFFGLVPRLEPSLLAIGGLLLVYAAIMCAVLLLNARVFLVGLRAEARAEHQSQTIGLLLRDFEDHASDWLWETTPDGRLRHVSHRLAETLRQPASALLDASLLTLLSAPAANDEERQALETLRLHLSGSAPFRDIAVPVRFGTQCQWWSLTAKPLFDDHGAHTGWRGVGTDVTRARESHQEMARLANFDPLTGLSHRHRFSATLERLATLGAARRQPFSLFFLDLDNFKQVNDSLGHDGGDRLLRAVAQRLQSALQPGELLSRLGGDEFALLSAPGAAPQEAEACARRLLRCFAAPFVIDGANLEIGTSIGIARFPQDGLHPRALLKRADLALYSAKAHGRNQHCFFEPELEQRALERLALQRDLRLAIERRELLLHFQPQISLGTGDVSSLEALVQWQHPRRGLLSPLEFIPLAEETGQIGAIGAWILREACMVAAEWAAPHRIAVNLSAVQFRSSSVTDVVQEALAASGLDPQRLELEITESVLMQDSAATQSTLAALRRRGVRIAIDDFGTGYSSLAYLRTFPLDKLKIDRLFVRAVHGRAEHDAQPLAVLRAIIGLAQALQLDTTAEGVETPEQLQALRELGCGDAQGFWLSRPLRPGELPAYFASVTPSV